MTARGSVENKTSIDVALSRLAENMNPMVVEIIEDLAGRNLWSPASLGDTWKGRIGSVEDIRKSQDPALFLNIVLSEWDSGFSRVMSPQGASFPLVDKVRQIRNAISHNDMNLLGNQSWVEDSIKAIRPARRRGEGHQTDPKDHRETRRKIHANRVRQAPALRSR